MGRKRFRTLPSRRLLLQAALLLTGAPSAPRGVAQTEDAEPLPLPNKDRLEGGDFLFPKKPGRYVPYHQGSSRTFVEERMEWERERRAMVEELSKRAPPAAYTAQLLAALRGLTFDEFYSHYMQATPDGQPTPYAAGPFPLGM